MEQGFNNFGIWNRTEMVVLEIMSFGIILKYTSDLCVQIHNMMMVLTLVLIVQIQNVLDVKIVRIIAVIRF